MTILWHLDRNITTFSFIARPLVVLYPEVRVDDVRKFVEVARSVGMKATLFRSLPQLRRELTSMGVAIG